MEEEEYCTSVIDILDDLINTSSTASKLAIIKRHKDNEILKKIFYYTYEKINLNYYVKKLWEAEGTGEGDIDDPEDFKQVEQMLLDLSSRKVTGHDALDLVQRTLEVFDMDSQEIIECILQRDLKAGISEKLINKSIPNLIPTFDVALANKYDKKTSKKVWDSNTDWYVSRKLDGVRCVAIKENDTFKFFSRKGKPFLTLDNLIPELLEFTEDEDNVIFDGEICLMDNQGNEDFTGIMKQIKKKNHSIPNPMYMIFDKLTPEEFYSKESERTFQERLQELYINDLHSKKFKSIKTLDQYVLNEHNFDTLQADVKKNGWEGLILRKNTSYKGKRSNDLLKVKKFQDAEYKVLSIETGPYQYTEKGEGQAEMECMTAVVIEHKKHKVNVGSGFTLDERSHYFEKPEDIIGKYITVQYFEETKNKQGGISLRFPTVKIIHDGKREV